MHKNLFILFAIIGLLTMNSGVHANESFISGFEEALKRIAASIAADFDANEADRDYLESVTDICQTNPKVWHVCEDNPPIDMSLNSTCSQVHGDDFLCGCSGKPYSFNTSTWSSPPGIPYSELNGEIHADLCTTVNLQDYIIPELASNDNLIGAYFGSINGLMRSYPAASWQRTSNGGTLTCREFSECTEADYDPRVRPWYTLSASGPKDLVLLLDNSGTLRDANKLELLKTAATKIIKSLSEYDAITIISFGGDSENIQLFSEELLITDSATKSNALDFIDSLVANGSPKLHQGLDKGLQVLIDSRNKGLGSLCHASVILLSDGQTAPTYQDLELVNQRNTNDLDARFFIYTIGNDFDPADLTSLRDLSCQSEGIFQSISLEEAEDYSYTELFQYFAAGLQNNGDDAEVRWSDLYQDCCGLGTTVTASLPVYDSSGLLVGVVGSDVPFDNWPSTISSESLLDRNRVCPALNLDLAYVESLRGEDFSCFAECQNSQLLTIAPILSFLAVFLGLLVVRRGIKGSEEPLDLQLLRSIDSTAFASYGQNNPADTPQALSPRTPRGSAIPASLDSDSMPTLVIVQYPDAPIKQFSLTAEEHMSYEDFISEIKSLTFGLDDDTEKSKKSNHMLLKWRRRDTSLVDFTQPIYRRFVKESKKYPQLISVYPQKKAWSSLLSLALDFFDFGSDIAFLISLYYTTLRYGGDVGFESCYSQIYQAALLCMLYSAVGGFVVAFFFFQRARTHDSDFGATYSGSAALRSAVLVLVSAINIGNLGLLTSNIAGFSGVMSLDTRRVVHGLSSYSLLSEDVPMLIVQFALILQSTSTSNNVFFLFVSYFHFFSTVSTVIMILLSLVALAFKIKKNNALAHKKIEDNSTSSRLAYEDSSDDSPTSSQELVTTSDSNNEKGGEKGKAVKFEPKMIKSITESRLLTRKPSSRRNLLKSGKMNTYSSRSLHFDLHHSQSERHLVGHRSKTGKTVVKELGTIDQDTEGIIVGLGLTESRKVKADVAQIKNQVNHLEEVIVDQQDLLEQFAVVLEVILSHLPNETQNSILGSAESTPVFTPATTSRYEEEREVGVRRRSKTSPPSSSSAQVSLPPPPPLESSSSENNFSP